MNVLTLNQNKDGKTEFFLWDVEELTFLINSLFQLGLQLDKADFNDIRKVVNLLIFFLPLTPIQDGKITTLIWTLFFLKCIFKTYLLILK